MSTTGHENLEADEPIIVGGEPDRVRALTFGDLDRMVRETLARMQAQARKDLARRHQTPTGEP